MSRFVKLFVSVFNSLDFSTALTVRDESNGDTTSGANSFYQGGAAPGTNRTTYALTCKRAKN